MKPTKFATVEKEFGSDYHLSEPSYYSHAIYKMLRRQKKRERRGGTKKKTATPIASHSVGNPSYAAVYLLDRSILLRGNKLSYQR